MDLCVRVLFNGGQVHKAVPITVATAIGGAAPLRECVTAKHLHGKAPCVRIGHPGGVMNVYISDSPGQSSLPELHGVAIQRTARRIAAGTLFLAR